MTVIRCKHCTRSFSTPARYQNHLRLAHHDGDEVDDDEAGPHLTAVDDRPQIRWEDPPFGRPDITSPLVDAIADELMANPGRWARVKDYPSKAGANSARMRVKQKRPYLEFRACSLPDGGSALYVRARKP